MLRSKIFFAGVILFSSLTVAAQPDFFDDRLVVVGVPTDDETFVNLFPFFQQVGIVQKKQLYNSDTILLHVDGMLTHTVDITDLRRSFKGDTYADSLARSRRDSVFNSELSAHDFYYKEHDGSRRLEQRKYVDAKGKYIKIEEYDFKGRQRSVTTREYDEAGNMTSETIEFKANNTTYRRLWKLTKGVVTQKVIEMWQPDAFKTTTTIDFNNKGSIIAYVSNKQEGTDVCTDKFKVDRDRNDRATKVSGTICKTAVMFSVAYQGNDINILRTVNKKKKTAFKITLIPTSN